MHFTILVEVFTNGISAKKNIFHESYRLNITQDYGLKTARKYRIIRVWGTYFIKLCNTYFLRKLQYSMDAWSIIFWFKPNWFDLKLIILNLDWPQKIILVAFWKYHFTWHNQNIIWEIFNLKYFVNMYPAFHEHFLLTTHELTFFCSFFLFLLCFPFIWVCFTFRFRN